MYCKILDETVSKLREEQEITEADIQQKRSTDPKIDVDYDLIIPKDYIFDPEGQVWILRRQFISINKYWTL